MKICVVGTGPWPLEEGATVTGPSIRLRQFIEPLQAARHDILGILLEDQSRKNIPIPDAIDAQSFTPEQILKPELLAEECDLNFVGLVCGVGSLMPAAAAARLAEHLNVPCWIDFFGDPLAELHASQLRQGGALDLTARDHIWKFVRECLLRGDAFSAVSLPQRYALMGQLGLLGRYGSNWDICKRIHEIPCGVPDNWTEPQERPEFPPSLIKKGYQEGLKYLFFGGSWNVWLDEVTMGMAVKEALEKDEELHFVSCGIPTGPAGQQIKDALFSPLEGFVESGRIIDLHPNDNYSENNLLAHAGACLSLDRSIPEAELGSRNRLLSMIRWGARPVVTVEAGIEAILVAEDLASGVFEPNISRTAQEILAACSRTPEQREDDRQRGVRWLRNVEFSKTLEPLVSYIRAGAKRWPKEEAEGTLDKWASFPADPEKLGPSSKDKKWWIF